MLGMGLGIRHVETNLPGIVYAFLSGLNSATVGLITVAGIRLARRAITGKITRLIICATGCLGFIYRGIFPFNCDIELI
jgi:chromate transport protein ChrA